METFTIAERDDIPATSTERSQKYRKTRLTPDGNEKAYLTRRFVAVDGEGINVRKGPRTGAHDYVLLAISGVDPLIKKDGLRTLDVLSYLWRNLSAENLNVIYGGSYDFNCWVADFPAHVLAELYHGKRVRYGAYIVKWLKGKQFTIKRDNKTINIYDVISFFQKPFLGACDEYLGKYKGRSIIEREKARRGNFTFREITSIGKYNQLELELLEQLCNELRLRLNKVGLRPKAWIGPGAIASALFEREKIKDHMDRNIPWDVAEAARYAYAGGRFEPPKFGISDQPAYEYDLNSAYPKALSLVPSLADGTWTHKTSRIRIKPGSFNLYLIEWNVRNPRAAYIPGPFFVRAPNGTISYPMRGRNWIWTPEAENAAEYAKLTGMKYRIVEAFEFTPARTHKPFGFVPAMYERRKALKAAKDGAHVGIKLGLNSMYGKCAQQVGYNKKTNEAPTYHQLEWAGYVTSWCRAQVLKAAMQDPDAVIAFETDALFTSRPLDLRVSDRLGEWEETVFTSLTYVQSGHYYGTKDDGEEVAKCRGIDRGNVSREDVEDAMREGVSITAPLTRFMGAGIALVRGLHIWRHWITEDKTLNLHPMGKRTPVAQDLEDGWNLTVCPVTGGMSSPFPILWINPNPMMTELAETREAEYDWDTP